MAEQKNNTVEKKRSWKDRLVDAGWLEESKTPQNQPVVPKLATTPSNNQKTKVSTSPGFSNSESPTTSTVLTSTSVNTNKEKAAMEHFLGLLDSVNLQGPDFFEFFYALKENVASMGGSVTDERMLYNMIFNTLKGMGLKSDILINTASHYTQALSQHYNDFLVDNQKLMDSKVKGRQEKINNLTTSNLQREEQIKKLQQEIVDAKAEIEKVETEIHTETINIEEAKVAFTSAYNKISSEINQVTENCKKYLSTK